ncbi:histidine kinase [Amorphoplanes digitatis]|uniref:histidine kinase n=1 Tax=Actinoplanes digitatis TaxID=1868 RepID=A0A7W7HYM9_9ACTN|nr:histidine kinase [Actinoplanes digitatis]MBB4763194.1 signal transduction histidine kinase [Actinoplanes digitatis]GID92012.1 two-component sensor histidine kinase [Actinoplanes digitatis]
MGELVVPGGGGRPSEYRWLLPASLLDDPDGPPAARSTRDWVIDTLCFALGLGWTLLATADLLSAHPTLVQEWAYTPRWLIWLDLAVGVVLSVALWWRRRWPVYLALLTVVAGAVTVAGAIAGLIFFFTVALHRRFAVTAAVFAGAVLTSAVFCALRPETNNSYWESMVWSAAFLVIVMLWGMVMRSRRQLVLSLRDRAERAESEQRLRIIQARALERTRIAREMHDVLAHRISLLSLHAGALEIRPDAAPAEVAGAAGVIRASAHQALQDLREVIGVLREPEGDDRPERPQPTLCELPALADESRAAGAKVRLDVRIDDSTPLPDGAGRTAYRIVQEGLTNARKHAPGTAVRVTVEGKAGVGLTIDVRNPAPVGRATLAIPGAGTGLVGLGERATLAGGKLVHGRTADGEFALSAWLPWAGPA